MIQVLLISITTTLHYVIILFEVSSQWQTSILSCTYSQRQQYCKIYDSKYRLAAMSLGKLVPSVYLSTPSFCIQYSASLMKYEHKIGTLKSYEEALSGHLLSRLIHRLTSAVSGHERDTNHAFNHSCIPCLLYSSHIIVCNNHAALHAWFSHSIQKKSA